MHTSNVKKCLTAAIISTVCLGSLSANAASVKPVTIPPINSEIGVASSIKVSGYHWVKPHYRSNGSFVNGYMRSNPDGYCWNNLSGC